MPTDEPLDSIDAIIASRKDMAGALLPILHGIQDAMGYVPVHAVDQIAQALNLSRAEVHGVLTYYHDFRTQPAAQHAIQICRAEACQAMGAQALWDHACAQLQCDHGGTPTGADIALKSVYCLGLCASSPAIVVDGHRYARVSEAALDKLLYPLRNPV